ncbi:hypothetical protein HZA97_08655 [Candidatus Woesearchaeota archaeon]|nr:hypothetical protein [Candidatus Woesearchaeota archaeon]
MSKKKSAKKFDSFMDLTGEGRELTCLYHGRHNVHLEGRILSEEKNKLFVGVSLHPSDVTYSGYNPDTKSLELAYQPPAPNTIRISILQMKGYDVPKDIKSIDVYDADSKMFPC